MVELLGKGKRKARAPHECDLSLALLRPGSPKRNGTESQKQGPTRAGD